MGILALTIRLPIMDAVCPPLRVLLLTVLSALTAGHQAVAGRAEPLGASRGTRKKLSFVIHTFLYQRSGNSSAFESRQQPGFRVSHSTEGSI